MKKSFVDLLACPDCKNDLKLVKPKMKNGEVHAGGLQCSNCKREYPIVDYIPRFVEDHYADNFGYEFKKYAKTQLDSFSGTDISESRFKFETDWDASDLKGSLVLEVGCGAGRFSEFPLKSGAELVSVDISSAVDVSLANLGLNKKHHLVQADVYNLPFKEGLFDKVFCLGVLQHTPNPKATLNCLISQAKKKGGKIVANCYQWTPMYGIQPKYLLRPFVKNLPHPVMLKAIHKIVPYALKFGRSASKVRVPIFSHYFNQFVPNFSEYDLSEEQWIDWGTLIIFDMLSPKYDKPQRIEDVREWIKEYDLEKSQVLRGIIIRATT